MLCVQLTLGYVIMSSLPSQEEAQQEEGEEQTGSQGLVPEDGVANQGHLGLQDAGHVTAPHPTQSPDQLTLVVESNQYGRVF